ncbi:MULTISPECIES: terminase TerL endonuclease subunit [unclassified Mesorhizobium]|uniref:terminase large subunit n=1 Tax=unclassified Mesorhizobium TaxID=325217 RepID=UPI00112D257A|nr:MULTISPECIES: terminase TerL endonuclease subunit [unclassified Mesorhizobium]TPJ86946.1 terminase [Mesorhizobium sp. B2-5-12]TPK19169.1 terminase [Mesorhizobium sp. B2-5-6]
MAKKTISRAERNIRWLEKHIRIPEGRFVGQPLKLAEFMKEDLRAIYDNPNGTRRAIISRGRKNAKTTESAMILLLHLCGPEAKRNAQLYSAAQSREQAAILFELAAKMIRMSPVLKAYAFPKDSGKRIVCPDLGTVYRALSADASTAYGLSPSLTVHDELGQVKGPRSSLYDALETATAAQSEPLSIIISTQAPTENDLLSILIDDAAKARDPRTVLRFQTAPEDMDPFTEEAIRAANPAFDLFMNQEEVLGMMEDARNMPSRASEFENLVLNRRVETSNPFVSRKVWMENAAEPNRDFKGRPVYGGLDLSETTDLTALVLVAPETVDGVVVWDVRPHFWLPGVGLDIKARLDRVEYDVWARDGLLDAVSGSKSIEYEFVAEYLREVCDDYDVRQIAFDRSYFKHLRPWLAKKGFGDEEIEAKFVEFGQGFVSMSPALQTAETLLLNNRIRHGDHKVLTMCAGNAVVKKDDAGNRKLTKAGSRGRIDGMVSLVMALAVAEQHLPDETNLDDFVNNMITVTW